MSFAHLCVHSNHSFLRGGSTPEQLCEQAAGEGMETLALTDVNGLYGIVPFVKAAGKAGIKPIVGVDLREPLKGDTKGYGDDAESSLSRRGFVEKPPEEMGAVRQENRAMKAILLVETQEGYPELCQIISDRHLKNNFNLFKALAARGPGVAVLSDDIALLDALVRARGAEGHFLALNGWKPWRRTLVEARQMGLLRSGVKAVASNDVWFAQPWDHWRHHLLTAIGLNVALSAVPAHLMASRQAWLKGREGMEQVFEEVPEVLINTAELAERCKGGPPLGGLLLPRFAPVGSKREPESWNGSLQHLREQCLRGVVWRYGTREEPRQTMGQIYPADDPWCPVPGRSGGVPVPDPALLRDDVHRQLEHELDIIAEMGYADYFLVVADIVRHARQEGIPTCGRGSAANSVVAYTLGLTHVDPLAHDLYFERFLNQGRSDAPDVDIDFSWRDRDRVLEYTYRTYGEERVAMIATMVTFQGRAAVREVAKVHGLPEGEIAQVTKRLGWFSGARQLREKIAANPRFRGIDLTDEPWSTVLAAAEQLDNFPRHLGVHPGGIIIAPERMADHVPVERAAKGLVITQWDMYPIEDAGLVKIDLLGNRSLAVIEDACNEVERLHNHAISYVHFDPTEDLATRKLVGKGDTIGCFYVESPAMRGLLQKLDCDDFDTLVAASSIIRPGVSSSGMMGAYIERHNGAPFTYLHPAMEEVLGETYGVMCYQEDVIKVAHHIAGMSLADADGLRKSMGKKRDFERIDTYRRQFMEGAIERGVEPDIAAELWRQIESFGGYSFCKAHSASYALVSYQAVFLRAHYPGEFMAAVLSNFGGFYTTFAYISEAVRMGLELRGPDVNQSKVAWTGYTMPAAVEAAEALAAGEIRLEELNLPDGYRGWLRVGFCQVRGLTEEGRHALVEARQQEGVFTGFDDLMERVDLEPAEIDALIRCGALDSLGEGSRPELMWRALLWRSAVNRNRSGASLELPLEIPLAQEPPKASQYDEQTIMAFEAEALDFLVSAHPLALYEDTIATAAAEKGSPLIEAKDLEKNLGKRVRVVGWRVTAKPIRTIHNEVMEFISFEDTTALYEVTVFPRQYRRYAPELMTRGPFILTGRVEVDWGAISLTMERLQVLGRGELPAVGQSLPAQQQPSKQGGRQPSQTAVSA